MISAVYQGLLSYRRHTEKREDPGGRVKSIDVRKVGSKKTFSELILFSVELFASSFLDPISKQAREMAAVSAFLLLLEQTCKIC